MQNDHHRSFFPGSQTRVGFGVIIVIACVAGFLLMFYAPPRHPPREGEAERTKILSKLPWAKAQWKAQNLLNYDVDVRRYSMFSPCWPYLSLQVREGKVTKVVVYSDFDAKSKQFTGTTRVYTSSDGYCDAAQLTVSNVFDQVEQHLEELNTADVYTSVTFNEVYGFVEDYRTEYNSQSVDHWLSEFTFMNFQPILTTSTPAGN